MIELDVEDCDKGRSDFTDEVVRRKNMTDDMMMMIMSTAIQPPPKERSRIMSYMDGNGVQSPELSPS